MGALHQRYGGLFVGPQSQTWNATLGGGKYVVCLSLLTADANCFCGMGVCPGGACFHNSIESSSFADIV